jgi:hypothetical protein
MVPDVHYKPGTSLEADGTDMHCRKFLPRLPEFCSQLARQLFVYSLERDAEVVIVRELKPKTPVLNANSLLDKGETLKGDKISVSTEKAIRRPRIRSGSSAHRAQYLKSRGYTFAQIETAVPPWGPGFQ